MSAPANSESSGKAGIPAANPLMFCGVIAGPLFVTTLLVQGAVRADYDPLRHPGSSLAFGEYGWIQNVNFVVAGLLALTFALGLRRTLRPYRGSASGPLLVAGWGVGLIGAGLFRTDPVSGYPPGTPNMIQRPSTHGAIHDLFSVPGFVALGAACFVLTCCFADRRERGWAIYSAVTGIVFAASFALAGAAFNQAEDLVDLGGLFQRITVVAGFGWLTALAVHLLNTPSPAQPKAPRQDPR